MKKSLLFTSKSTIFTVLLSVSTLPLTIHSSWAKTSSVDNLTLADGIHLLRVNSNMGNTSSVVSIGKQGVLLIDPNFDGSAELIKQKITEIAKHSNASSQIKYLTSTHVHRDHTEQYPIFLKNSQATAIVPENQRLELAQSDFMQGQLPNATFNNKITLHFNDETIELATLPNIKGHTNGDLVVYFKQSKILYVGDYLFIDRYPVIDKNLGEVQGYLNNIKHMIETYPPETTVVPGHGSFEPDPLKTINMQQYRQYHQDLVATVEYIQKQKKAGKSKQQIIKQGLPKRFAHYGQKPRFVSEQRWIERVY